MNAVTIRPPAVAGLFYPAAPAALTLEIDSLLSEAQAGTAGPSPKAIIVPHAAFKYSGPIAAAAYARLKPARGTVSRVVLVGPAHRVPFRGLALPSVGGFRTPLGDVLLDTQALAKLRRLPTVSVRDDAHAAEHSLEVQLPFLQHVLGEFSLVPIALGETTGAEVMEVLDVVWGGRETLIVISSDLSHYHDYTTAKVIDNGTAAAVERLDGGLLDGNRACGYTGIQGLLREVTERALTISRIDLRNSGDTAGPRNEVVGYGAWSVAAS